MSPPSHLTIWRRRQDDIKIVKASVRWATGKRLTNRLPKLSLITLPPPVEHWDSWSSYGAVRAYSEVLYNLWGPTGRVIYQILDVRKFTFLEKAFSWWT